MFNDYIEYFRNFVKDNDIYPMDIILDNLDKIEKEGESKYTIESLGIIHMNLYRKRNYKFLDYFNYKRCIEGNLSLDNF